MESSSQDESQQDKLKRNLIHQFERNELHQVTVRFMEILVQNSPHLKKNTEDIVDYLVNIERNDDELLSAITSFLKIADEFAQAKVNIELAKDLFAYLLQTLVNEPEVSTGGVNWVSVNYIPTVKLIYAAEKGIAVVPDYDDREYKAGKRNARFEYIGDFQSRDALWTVESVCEKIAEKLLEALRETRRSPKGALRTLSAKLIHSDYDAAKSPLHGIFIEAGYLEKHPFNNPHVVQHFMEKTSGRLPIYIYKVEQPLNGFKNLKIDEDDLMFFLEGDYKLLNRNSISETEEVEEKIDLLPNIGKVENLYLNQNNYITLSKNAIEELQLKVPQLKQEIEIGQADISKKDYGEITRAVRILEEAMENQGKIEKDKIGEILRVRELYKDELSLPASIMSILSFILTHLS